MLNRIVNRWLTVPPILSQEVYRYDMDPLRARHELYLFDLYKCIENTRISFYNFERASLSLFLCVCVRGIRYSVNVCVFLFVIKSNMLCECVYVFSAWVTVIKSSNMEYKSLILHIGWLLVRLHKKLFFFLILFAFVLSKITHNRQAMGCNQIK